MDHKAPPSLILLTYKNKALLMYKQNSPIDEEKHAWSFISGSRPTKAALVKNVMREMGIKIDNIEKVSDSFYHASLTDYNVNNIKRAEGQMLAFFTLKETRDLLLSKSTEEFISKHGALISNL
jgi:hypothetical protein